jgi:hypothetical protein
LAEKETEALPSKLAQAVEILRAGSETLTSGLQEIELLQIVEAEMRQQSDTAPKGKNDISS